MADTTLFIKRIAAHRVRAAIRYYRALRRFGVNPNNALLSVRSSYPTFATKNH